MKKDKSKLGKDPMGKQRKHPPQKLKKGGEVKRPKKFM